MLLFFAMLVLGLVIHQYYYGGVWDRGWRWHTRQDNPDLFRVTIVLQLFIAIALAVVHFVHWKSRF